MGNPADSKVAPAPKAASFRNERRGCAARFIQPPSDAESFLSMVSPHCMRLDVHILATIVEILLNSGSFLPFFSCSISPLDPLPSLAHGGRMIDAIRA